MGPGAASYPYFLDTDEFKFGILIQCPIPFSNYFNTTVPVGCKQVSILESVTENFLTAMLCRSLGAPGRQAYME